MLEVINLTKDYPTPRGSLRVLADVSLSLAAGGAAAITGPSGSGKSSLLYAIGALEAPSSGRVVVDGIDPATLSPTELADFRNSRIGFVFQDHCLLPQCSVLENVLVPTLVARPRSNSAAREDEARARALLARVGLGERMDHRPAQLSGGERQRVAIARALVRRPGVLLCDEPTGNLDADAAHVVATLLLELHREQQNVLVVVTHSAALAAMLPTRFGLIAGRLEDVSRDQP